MCVCWGRVRVRVRERVNTYSTSLSLPFTNVLLRMLVQKI